jgi:hypothetical protein
MPGIKSNLTMLGSYAVKAISVFSLCQFFCCCSLKSQEVHQSISGFESIRKNSIYLEILGNAAYYSVNYDRIVPLKDKKALFLRFGGNALSESDSSDKICLGLLIEPGILMGGPTSFFETGIGYTYFTRFTDQLYTFTAGYRYQGAKGFVFRATPMYIMNTEKGDVFGNHFWFGISFGYSF